MSEDKRDKNGFAIIDVNFNEDERNMMIEAYVKSKLSPASISMFECEIDDGATVETALYKAVFNEFIIEAVTLTIKKLDEQSLASIPQPE